MKVLRDYWPLFMLWGAVAGVIGSGVAMWVLSRHTRAWSSTANVIQLPPAPTRSGPTHVVLVRSDVEPEPA